MFAYYVQPLYIHIIFKKCQNYIHQGSTIKHKIL